MYEPIPYHIAAVGVYACILATVILALVYGLRARANVKKERITALAKGFSPLDVQRIFIGKTYPRRLTRALIVHWAQMGYIRVRYLSRCKVRLILLKKPPVHSNDGAVFFDRGTYVRERDVFNKVFGVKDFAEINLNLPLITKARAKSINGNYAVREDEGVYSAKHYRLKVATFALSFAPLFLCGIYLCVVGQFVGIIPPFMMLLGMFVFRFMREIPFWFRFIWSFLWVFGASAIIIFTFNSFFDPWKIAYASVVFLFISSYILIRFIDHREKNNLADYSDLVNYRKFLLFSGNNELKGVDYYEALPYLYAFNIKLLAGHKFSRARLPDWFESPSGERGSLL